MPKEFKEKYNSGCIKIFKLLELLYDNNADYNKVAEILGDFEESDNLKSVSINKYMNTLKVFGINVKKVGSKYVMQNSPFPSEFNINDLKAVKMLRDVQIGLPNSQATRELDSFLRLLEEKFDDKTASIYKSLTSNDNYNVASNLKTQIELCEKYCDEKYKINIKYLKDNQEMTLLCAAQQVIYDTKSAYLRVYKAKENEFEDINIAKIISIEQLPAINCEPEACATVIFTLKGRLAKAYKLKDNEYLSKVNEDGSIVVVNKNEPIDALLKRLIRYDEDCFINNPKSLRIKMLNLVDNILKMYDEK